MKLKRELIYDRINASREGSKSMKKATLIFSYIMFSITMMIAIFMFVSFILGVVNSYAVPPIIVCVVMTGLFLLLALHYIKCIKFQKHKQIAPKCIKRTKNINLTLTLVIGVFSFAMFISGLWPNVFLGLHIDLSIIFIVAGLVFSLYPINLVMINKNLNIDD